MKKTNSGFTLIELLIGIVLSSMVFIVALSLIVSVMNYSSKSKYNQKLEQTKNDLTVDLSTNVKWADKISISGSGNSFTVNNTDGVANYALSGGTLTKNGKPLTSDQVSITDFEVKKHTGVLEIKIDMESKLRANLRDSLDLILSPRGENAIE